MTTSWRHVPLREVASIDRSIIPADSIESGTIYVGLEHITSAGQFAGHRCVEAGELLSNKFRFTSDHVLYGKLRPNLSKIAAPRFAGICSTDIVPIRPSARLDKRYLLHFLRQPAEVAKAASLASGANLPRLSPRVLEELPVSLPPIEEQRRIATVLDQADELRTKRQATIALVGVLSEAMFVDMFGDPSGWAQVERPLIELADPARPISYGILKPGPDVERGVPYVRVVDMRLGGIDVTSIRRTSPQISHQYRRSLLQPGDLLLSIRGHVGRLAEVPPGLDSANITQDTARLAIKAADPRFVLQFLRSSWAQRWMRSNTKGAAVRGINLSDVKRLPVPVFERSDQDELVRRVRMAEQTEHAQRRSLRELDALFSSLEHRAFAGQL